MMIFVIGSALRQICGDQSKFGLTFVRSAVTAPQYRLFTIEDRFAALVAVSEGGMAISGEVCELSDDTNKVLLTTEPAGVEQKMIELADGILIASAVSTPSTLPAGAVDISDFGSFSAFIQSRTKKAR